MDRLKTISKDYLRMNKNLHKRPKGFGGGGARHAEAVVALAKEIGAETLLDYGAGQCKLSEALTGPIAILFPNFDFQFKHIQNYDPAITAISAPPQPADIVACTDVLEHIEPSYLGNVLIELYELTRKAAYFEIATRPANKVLPDGRNAHLIVEGEDWWTEKIAFHQPWARVDVQRVINPEKEPQLRSLIFTCYR